MVFALRIGIGRDASKNPGSYKQCRSVKILEKEVDTGAGLLVVSWQSFGGVDPTFLKMRERFSSLPTASRSCFMRPMVATPLLSLASTLYPYSHTPTHIARYTHIKSLQCKGFVCASTARLGIPAGGFSGEVAYALV